MFLCFSGRITAAVLLFHYSDVGNECFLQSTYLN